MKKLNAVWSFIYSKYFFVLKGAIFTEINLQYQLLKKGIVLIDNKNLSQSVQVGLFKL